MAYYLTLDAAILDELVFGMVLFAGGAIQPTTSVGDWAEKAKAVGAFPIKVSNVEHRASEQP